MISAFLGALLGIGGLSLLIDNLAGTNVTQWFFEKCGSIIMFFLEPLFDFFLKIYDGLLAVVTGFFK